MASPCKIHSINVLREEEILYIYNYIDKFYLLTVSI